MRIAETARTERWVTVALDDRHSIRCLVEPAGGRPRVTRIEPADGCSEVPISALRGLRLGAVVAALQEDATQEPVHAQAQNRTDDELLAMVAIAHDEFEASGVRDPARAVSEWLDELHDISHDRLRDPYLRDDEFGEPWCWGDGARVAKYSRSGARGLLRKARRAGYLRRPEQPRVIEDCQTREELSARLEELGVALEDVAPAEYSATGTLARARERRGTYYSEATASDTALTPPLLAYDSAMLKAAARFHEEAVRRHAEPSDYVRARLREQRLREDRHFLSADEIEDVLRAARTHGFLNADGTATADR